MLALQDVACKLPLIGGSVPVLGKPSEGLLNPALGHTIGSRGSMPSQTTSSPMSTATKTSVRQILTQHGRLADLQSLDDSADLYQAGMTSHASVNVMLALENEFEIEFPDHMLKRSVFESVDAITEAIEEIRSKA
jgi:acyl carrier protein